MRALALVVFGIACLAAAFIRESGPCWAVLLGRTNRANRHPVTSATGLGIGVASAPSSYAKAFPSRMAQTHERSSGVLAGNVSVLAAATAFAMLAISRRRNRRSARRVVQLRYHSLCNESDAPDSMRRRFEAVVAESQERICRMIEELDGEAKFSKDEYTRENGGGGVARVMTNSSIFEKAGVNLSVVYGQMPQEALAAANDRGVDRVGTKLAAGEKVPFFACGLSCVMHPKNPFCPTMHFNYRYFETDTGTWWFGGGTDITPSYLDEDDMKHFHGTYKQVCDQHDSSWYSRFKDNADKYFVIPHRGETRGLGGIFFDDFNTESPDKHLLFSSDCLRAVTDAYVPLLEKNRHKQFTTEQKDWQQIRRGRYVEFNLVYDRGTIFGLKMLPTGVGRIESILMSLPQTARWEYDHEPQSGSPEAELIGLCREPRDWV